MSRVRSTTELHAKCFSRGGDKLSYAPTGVGSIPENEVCLRPGSGHSLKATSAWQLLLDHDDEYLDQRGEVGDNLVRMLQQRLQFFRVQCKIVSMHEDMTKPPQLVQGVLELLRNQSGMYALCTRPA